MLQAIAETISPSLAPLNGRVFYSGRRAFSEPNPIYILGFNPGGAPENHPSETISNHSGFLLQSAPARWSAYLDKSWEGQPAGTAKLQRRLCHLLCKLGLDPREVPASNLIFTRSRRIADIGGDVKTLVDLCWPTHVDAIKRLGSQAVICLGNDTGNKVRALLGASRLLGTFKENNARGWASTCWQAQDGKLVFSLAHPAIADWTKAETDPSAMVRDCLRKYPAIDLLGHP